MEPRARMIAGVAVATIWPRDAPSYPMAFYRPGQILSDPRGKVDWQLAGFPGKSIDNRDTQNGTLPSAVCSTCAMSFAGGGEVKREMFHEVLAFILCPKPTCSSSRLLLQCSRGIMEDDLPRELNRVRLRSRCRVPTRADTD